MRLEGTRKSGTPDEKTLYIFCVGKEELRVMAAALSKAKTQMIRLPETEQVIARLRNMVKVTGQILRDI